MASDWTLGHRGFAIAAAMMLLLGLGLSAARTFKKYQTPGPPDPINEGYCDFHNGVYFPSLALLDGVSPYGSQYAAEYPVSRQIPFFSPAILAIHAPLSLLPLRVSEIVYFGIMVALIIAISSQSLTAAGLPRRLDWILAIAAGIVFSRAGHVTLFNGYFTFELVLATILAIQLAPTRPYLAAIALVVVSAKPTYVLPLGLLMLARGNIKALVVGAIMSIIAAAIPLGWLAWNQGSGNIGAGLAEIRQQISAAQAVHHGEPNELPVLSWTRIDILAIVAKWTEQDPSDEVHLIVMLVLLAIPIGLLFRRRKIQLDDSVAGLTGALVLTSMIVALYRQSYDCLILAPLIIGLVAGILPAWKSLGLIRRWILAAMLLFPAYNYLSTHMILDKLKLDPFIERLLTSMNAVVMVIALIWIVSIASHQLHQRQTDEQATPQ